MLLHGQGQTTQSPEGEKVMLAPYFQDFNSVSTPDLPDGWHKIVDNPDYPQAAVGTTTSFSPFSPPNHARLLSNDYEDADILLITPEVTDYDSKRIRFRVKISHSTSKPDLIIGTMTDPADASTFTAFTTIPEDTLTSSYQLFTIEFDDTVNDNTHIAFKHGATPSGNRNIFIDNFAFEDIPTGPVIAVMPDSWDFGKIVFGETGNPREFIIKNTGIGVLSISPEDISITGPDADRFILENISETVNLEEFETATINVSFSPENIGHKEATLQVDDLLVPLSGEGIDPTITEIPYEQDFSEFSPPDLGFGWSKIVQTTSTGGIESISTGGPNSPPNHIRFQNMIDAGAQLILITPEIALDLSSLRVRFYSKALSGDDNAIEVGTITNPDNIATFTSLETFTVTTSYQEFTYSFADYEGEDTYIAFKAALPDIIRTIYFDDFVLEAIPEVPIMQVSPTTYDFGPIQTGTSSDEQEFTISNQGEGLLVIGPDDIAISGTHAAEFELNNLTETVELAAGESAVIGVTFSPDTEGDKTATLEVDDFDVPLLGEGIDATITEFPYIEDFSGVDSGTIPFGWIRDVTNWRVTNTDYAGGEAPELRFMWSPVIEGEFYIKTPLINTSGFDQMWFSFKHFNNNFADPGPYTLRLVTIDGDEENIIHEWVDPANIPQEEFWTILTQDDHGIGSEELRLAFVFDGNTAGLRDWNIDDVTLKEVPDFYEVTFSVVENSPDEDPIEGAQIALDAYVPDLTTGNDGIALAELPDGTYMATITAAGYEDEQVSFTVDGSDLTVDVLMTDIIEAPYNLEISTHELEPGEALFTWDHDGFNSGKILTGFNVYLDDLNDPLANVEELQYLFTGLETGNYTAGVEAVYTTGTSEVITIEFDLEVIDVPVLELPWEEDFTGTSTGDLPDGWIANAENWGVVNTSNAGGEAPEMRFYFMPEAEGVFYLRSPYLNTGDYDQIYLSFKNFVNNFSDPGEYTLRVLTRVNGEENLVHEWVDPDNIEAHTFSAVLNAEDHGVGSDSLQIVWVFDGNTSDINWWNFDDVFVGEVPDLYSVTFNVEDQDGNPVTGATLTFDNQQMEPGEYVVENVLPGTYDYSLTKEGYSDASGTVEVIDQNVVENVVMEEMAYTVTFEIEDEEGNPLTGAIITFDGETFDPDVYVFENVTPGTYEYLVSLEGFFDHEDEVVVTDEDVLVNVVLLEDDTGIAGTEAAFGLDIFPNPAGNTVNIESAEKITGIRIFDMLGQLVYSSNPQNDSHRLNVSEWKDGLYFVQVQTETGSLTKRLQISR